MSPSTQSSGYSLYYILFGREMPLPIDISLLPNEALEKAPKEYFNDLINKVKIIQDLIKENVKKTRKKTKEKYDKMSMEPELKNSRRSVVKNHDANSRKKPQKYNLFGKGLIT
jgi:hypothetical protein